MIIIYPEYKVVFVTHTKCGETNLNRALGVNWPKIRQNYLILKVNFLIIIKQLLLEILGIEWYLLTIIKNNIII
jgi:hypothetical protein